MNFTDHMDKGKLLLFNINIFRQGSIAAVCAETGIEAVPVPKTAYQNSLEVIAGIASGTSSAQKNVDFEEEMLVFCHVDPQLMDRFLSLCREKEIGVPQLKAVLTPVNRKWLPGMLCSALSKERQFLDNTSGRH